MLKDAQIALAPRIEFFGGSVSMQKMNWFIMIDDPQQKLSALNSTLKTTALYR